MPTCQHGLVNSTSPQALCRFGLTHSVIYWKNSGSRLAYLLYFCHINVLFNVHCFLLFLLLLPIWPHCSSFAKSEVLLFYSISGFSPSQLLVSNASFLLYFVNKIPTSSPHKMPSVPEEMLYFFPLPHPTPIRHLENFHPFPFSPFITFCDPGILK